MRIKQHNERIRAGVKLAQADMRARGENTTGTRTYEQRRDAALKGIKNKGIEPLCGQAKSHHDQRYCGSECPLWEGEDV